MVTETIIDLLKKDATLRGLLGITGTGPTAEAAAPVMAAFTLTQVTDKAISIGVVYGETDEMAYEHGIVNIEVYVHNTTNNAPVKLVSDISMRIISLLDLKGSQLSGSLTTTVYRLRKTAFDMLYDDVSQCHIGVVNFEFYVSR
jgi:hypothetical protein